MTIHFALQNKRQFQVDAHLEVKNSSIELFKLKTMLESSQCSSKSNLEVEGEDCKREMCVHPFHFDKRLIQLWFIATLCRMAHE